MKKKLLIIGAGWSGIYMLKHALEEGIDAEIYEEKDYPLGIWHYTRLPGGVLRNTHATSSKYHMSPTDFPFSENTPLFPHHDLIEKHMLDYMKHFKLEKHIRYGKKIQQVQKKNGKWEITISGGTKKTSDFLAVATGLNKAPHPPKDDYYKKFSGKKIHSHYFNETIKEKYQKKKVLVIGGGETACDIAHILSQKSDVTLSIRRGLWFQSTIMGATAPADMFSNRALALTKLGLFWANKLFAKETAFWWGKGGSGIQAWQPTAGLLNTIYNKSRDVIMDDISKGAIKPKGGVKNIQGKKVAFIGDNTWHEFDLIIFGTGYDYKSGLSFLDEKYYKELPYKLMFYPQDPTLAFIGYARPFVGSIPSMSEVQSRLAASVFAGKTKLPNLHKMKQTIKKDAEKTKRYFTQDYQRSPFVVNPPVYIDQLLKLMKAGLKPIKLLLTKPKLWFKVYFEPISVFQSRIEDENPKKRAIAIQEIEKISSTPVAKKVKGMLLQRTFIYLIYTILLFMLAYQLIKV